jgi:glucokinase
MRVIEDLIAEDLVAYDGFDEANVRGRPRARIKFRGAAHAIIGIEAGKGEFYGAVANLEGVVQTEMHETADDDGERNLEKLVGLIRRLMAAPARAARPFAASALAALDRQAAGGRSGADAGLGWRDMPLRRGSASIFKCPSSSKTGATSPPWANGDSGPGVEPTAS